MVFPIFNSPYMTAEEQAAFYLKKIREVATHRSPWEGQVKNHAHPDDELMREALEALKPTQELIASMIYIGTVKTCGIETAPALETVRAAITKLEERLLRE